MTPKHMRRLDAADFARACARIQSTARPLEHARFAYHFEGGSTDDVLAALAEFQNSDGGFGHGLEPDLQTPVSSVLATTIALQIIRELAAPADHPLVHGAMSYIAGSYDADQQGWPFVPPASEDSPHAPWWNGVGLTTDLSRFHANPRAEVVGYLYDFPGYVDKESRDLLATAVLNHLDTLLPKVEMHDFFCYWRLVSTQDLPEQIRGPLLQKLRRAADTIVARDPEAWQGYGIQPISIAPLPTSVFADQFADALPANLDMIIAQQEHSGGWGPPWSWEDAFPDVWPDVKQILTGMLTVNTLVTLRAYGRLANG